MAVRKTSTQNPASPNKLCSSCRRTCKQAAAAVVASCPRYYPFRPVSKKPEFDWKQLDLGL